MRRLTALIATTMLILPPALFGHAQDTTHVYAVAKYTKANNPLLKMAQEKGTVGIIPYHVENGKTYILLGQELTGGKREASGTFSDLGGSIKPDGQTILQHALREFTEESMGQMRLSEADVLKNGYLLFKKSAKNRPIYYILVKFSDKQYAKTKKFHCATVRLKASSVPNCYLEKEMFMWMQLDDLLPSPVTTVEPTVITADTNTPATVVAEQSVNENFDSKRFIVHTPDGKSHCILIRGYFLRDCLHNAELPKLLQQLSK